MQCILKTLFVLHPYKSPKGEEYLRGGRFYRDLDIVTLPGQGEHIVGQEGIGRAVWESLEKGVEEWEKEEKEILERMEKERAARGESKDETPDGESAGERPKEE